jgi:hypothetical protein
MKYIPTQKEYDKVQVGSIFVWSWGWEQTNLDFFQVIEKKTKSVIVREIAQETVEGSTYSHGIADNRVAVKDAFLKDSKPQRKVLKFMQGRPYLHQEYGWCELWDGTPQYSSWYA